MARQIPKNVRQIGNVSDSSKIYIEDYVDTFFNQLCEKTSEGMQGAFLIGEIVQEEENDYIYVSGAIKMRSLNVKGKDIFIEESVWKDACETCKEYFGNAEILGWFVTGGDHPLEVNHNIQKVHQKYFPREKSIFVTKNSRDKDEKYYIQKFREMLECKGHFIYYEKNGEMQNYMIACRKKTGMTPSEVIEDRAAKNFRSLIRDKVERNEQKSHMRLVYTVSTFLVLVVLVIGVTMLNNYDKMQDVKDSMNSVADNAGENDAEKQEHEEELEESVQASGEIVDEELQGEEVQDEGENQDIQQVEGDTLTGDEQGSDTSDVQLEEIYIVEEGDTIASISRKIYGDISRIEEICELNGLEDGNLIMIGQKLLLP